MQMAALWWLVACSHDQPEQSDNTDVPPSVDTDEPNDRDLDGVAAPTDCDDEDPLVHPGSPEWCDGFDNDCDPTTTDTRAFFQPTVGARVDLSDLLGPGITWTATRPGTVQLCPGPQEGSLVLRSDQLTVQSSPLGRAALDGGAASAIVVEPGFRDVLITGLDLTGSADRGGGIRIDNDAAATLDDLQISGASAEGGGALWISASSAVTLTHSSLRQNTAALGGAVWVGREASLIVSDLDLEGNHATYMGGAIYLSELSLGMEGESVEIRDNTAGDMGGGLAADSGTARVACTDCTWTGNRATRGGGAWMELVGEVLLSSTEITANQATGDHGGGLFLEAIGPHVVLSDVRLRDNVAAGSGGGMWLFGAPELQCTNLTLEDNLAGASGGGMYAWALAGTFEGLTVTANRAEEEGGGVVWIDSYLEVSDSQVDGNEAATGGGAVIEGGDLSTSNSDLFDNTADLGGALAVRNEAIVAVVGGQHTGNTARLGAGCWVESGEVWVQDGVWSSNVAAEKGGAAYVSEGAAWAVFTSTFRGNEAAEGAVVWGAGDVVFEGGAAAQNTASVRGGVALMAGGELEITATDLGTPGVDDNSLPEIVTTTAELSLSGVSDLTCDAEACR